MERIHKAGGEDKQQIGEDEQTCVGLREIDRRAVEVGPLVEGLEETCCCGSRGGASVICQAHDERVW